MNNQLRFLQDLLKENNPLLSPGLQSIAQQLQDVSKIQQRNLFPSNAFLKAMENSQRSMNLLGQNIIQSQKNLLNNISIHDNYNFTGLLSLENKLSDIAKNQNLAFNSIAGQLANQAIKSNFRFTHSFQSVAKILSDQTIGIPNDIIQEFKNFSDLIAEDLHDGQNIEEIRESVEGLALNYQDDSIKKYTFGEVIHTIVFYVSFLLALHNIITNADENILLNQEEIINKQQEIVSKVESSISQNQELLEKTYKIDPSELDSFVVTQNILKVRKEPNDTSASKFELNANAVIKLIEKNESFARIKFFDFENHEFIEGWIPLGYCTSLEHYLEY